MPRVRTYTILLRPDPEEGGFWVSVPALPGCYSQGDTLEEAITHAREAISLHVEGLIAEGLPVPEETAHPQAIAIDVVDEAA
ncbi:MAG: type II toxin-antitoxin system HicB family antitoxin [Chloroflexi bacterium]|nr:type II toxin-antitoxin system HicB family antitoxin [Chloroflexota bacterium]